MADKQQTILPKEEYCSLAGLKARGWTDSAVRRFLPIPDKSAVNPHYKCAAPMKLYLIKRVETVENSPEYKDLILSSQKRRDAARRAALTKREVLLELVRNLIVSVEKIEYNELLRRAIQAYNEFHESIAFERGRDFLPATMSSDRGFLERIAVNHLRHEMSPYEDKLSEIYGKIGVSGAYPLLLEKIYRKISETYPNLKDECERQLSRKRTEIDGVIP